MKVLVTGKGGQLAWELSQTVPTNIELIELDVDELDISDQNAVNQAFNHHQPNAVINAAAYTAVDRAEEQVDLAYAVNRDGAAYIAEAASTIGARLIHVSTDFVFDGTSSVPYSVSAKTNPLGVYGASKLEGDIAVQNILPSATIIRTAWVYSAHGNNFVKTMLRLMNEKKQLGIVYDQVGTPTWAKGLAQLLWNFVENPDAKGIFHWTDAGVASWYDFAVAIQELGLQKGLLDIAIPISPIPASAYPTPALRPSFSVLDKSHTEQLSGIQTVHWRKQLSQMMDELLTITR